MNENSELIDAAIQNLNSFCNKNLNVELWPGGPTGLEYVSGLVRCDKFGGHRGSYVEGVDTLHKTINFLNSLDWHECIPNNPRENCRYFQVFLKDHISWCGIVTVRECDLDQIQIVNGLHGNELTIPKTDRLEQCDIITLIVEGDMMSTWFPGPLTDPNPEVFPEDRETWNPNWAVKLV